MKLYFSGFCLENESELFSDYIVQNDFTVNGFSYGAVKAFEYALNTKERIDKIQLFSPAFFNDKDKKYKRMQLMFFNKDAKTYCDNFLKNCGFTKELSLKYFKLGTFEELEELLYYWWDKDKLQKLIDKDIQIEIYLGGNDKIIDSKKALEFFQEFGDVYFIKNKGHIL
ncbi:MAG: pimelyl-ACP methyl ester esterase BioV [Campylobacterota bacterium]|nr:pimelyl-ACP methyl ester esterase BioV [Campylobacterota bacterium]